MNSAALIQHSFIKIKKYGLAGSAFQLKTGLEARLLEEQVGKELKIKIAQVLHDVWKSEKECFKQLTTFKVNEYITLKLEDVKTVIYVNGRLFSVCKYLLFSNPLNEQDNFDRVDSIDEAEEFLDHSLKMFDYPHYVVPADTLFWGHCSNIQAWAENNYDTRLLHRKIAFPLLKSLVYFGDIKAKEQFAKEIKGRAESGYLPVIEYLIIEGYFEYLPPDYINVLANKTDFLSQFASDHNLLKRSELLTTETELKAMAAAAKIGFRRIPKKGYNMPAAMGIVPSTFRSHPCFGLIPLRAITLNALLM